MQIDVTRQDLINLVKSNKPKSMQECVDLTNEGLMYFSGNQWNTDWNWEKGELDKLSDKELLNLYNKHKDD